jgi:hypothetical protein
MLLIECQYMPQPNGRPLKFTKELLDKLEYAFALGCSDREACLYAGVSPAALYKYQEKHPEFAERKADLKESPVLLARESVNKGIKRDPKLAFAYLKAKKRDEFAGRRLSEMSRAELQAFHKDHFDIPFRESFHERLLVDDTGKTETICDFGLGFATMIPVLMLPLRGRHSHHEMSLAAHR